MLRGSCLLKYNLLPAYPNQSRGVYRFPHLLASIDSVQGSSQSIGGLSRDSWLLIGIIVVLLTILYLNNRPSSPGGQRRAPRRGGWFGGWGGGPGAPPHDPPPPYRPYPKPEDQATSSGTSWRPGFWSGLGAGALAAEASRYLRTQNSQPRGYPAHLRFNDGGDSFGRGGRSRFDDDSDSFGQAGPSRMAESGSTHRSYGFGGSSVR